MAKPVNGLELMESRVSLNEVADWQLDAARFGVRFAAKLFPQLAASIKAGRVPEIKWFGGSPARRAWGAHTPGATHKQFPDIWLAAQHESWPELIDSAAHEAAHLAGVREK